MAGALEGVRVVEVAMWAFMPTAGAVMAEWGADVLKVEHPVHGDPMRGLITSGFLPGDAGGANYMVEVPNRGKRSVGIDLKHPDGRALVLELAKTADVFLTSLLPASRRKLGIDLEDVRAVNPGIIYARGSGTGQRGPGAERGAFDSSTYWARGGVGYALSPPDRDLPIRMRSAFGDVMGGLTMAGGIAAALLKRERTGEPSTVDVSLLGMATWNLSVDVATASAYPDAPFFRYDEDDLPNPVVRAYRTSDGRHLYLTLLQSDRYWPELCRAIGREDLLEDERFIDASARRTSSVACIAELADTFASRTLDEWKRALSGIEGAWEPFQSPAELLQDPDVVANGNTVSVQAGDRSLSLAANPVQFDQTAPSPPPAPEIGQHTEEVLLELGHDWPALIDMKDRGVIS